MKAPWVSSVLSLALYLQWCVTIAMDPSTIFPGFCAPDGENPDICPVMCVTNKMCTYGTNGRCLKTACGSCRCRYDEEELNGPIHCVSTTKNSTACPQQCFTNAQCKHQGTGKLGACVLAACGNCHCDFTGLRATTESHPSHSEFLPEKVKVKSSEGRKATAQPLLDPSLTMLQADCIPQLGYEVDSECLNECTFDSDCTVQGHSCQRSTCGGCGCLPRVAEEPKDCVITSGECWSDCEHHRTCGVNGRCVPSEDPECHGACVCETRSPPEKDCVITSGKCWSDCEQHSTCGVNGRCVPSDDPECHGACVCETQSPPETVETQHVATGNCWCDGDLAEAVDNYLDFLRRHLLLLPLEKDSNRKYECVDNNFRGADCERQCCQHTECKWPLVCRQDDCEGCQCDYFDPLIYARDILGIVTSCGGRRRWPNPEGAGAYTNCDDGYGGMCVGDEDCEAGYICLPNDDCGGCWCQAPNE